MPVEQAFSWEEGIILKGASIESETTAAVLGAEGVRKFDLMSNLAFISVPIGKYIQSNLNFEKDIKDVPSIFSVNYFLKDDKGEYLNAILDKTVWILWAELRVNGDVEAIDSAFVLFLMRCHTALIDDPAGHFHLHRSPPPLGGAWYTSRGGNHERQARMTPDS